MNAIERMFEEIEEQIFHEGVLDGIRKGRCAFLLNLLRKRFGNQVDTALEGEIHTASRDELIDWSDRIFSATTLDELRDPQPTTHGALLRQQGEQRGIQRGQCLLMIRQLRGQFGRAVNDAVERRLEAASSEQLVIWGERLLSAKTLIEVLGD